MNMQDAIRSIIKPHEEDQLTPLSTVWGEGLSPGHVLPEYPRPQMQRDSFLSLNGSWEYAITPVASVPPCFPGKILVPFSPESTLSGVSRQLKPTEYLWYRRPIPSLPGSPEKYRTILHFGAVDYRAGVYINRRLAATHEGGYLPFQADITDYLTDGENELIVKVQDTTDLHSQARGKQSLKRGGIFYTAQSGIWQSVWLEQVPLSHIDSLWFETDYDARRVTAHINTVRKEPAPALCLSVFCKEKEIIRQCQGPGSCQDTISFTIPEEYFHSWSPKSPFLYPVSITFGPDKVQSYFAMRLYSVEIPDPKYTAPEGSLPENVPVFCLNHKPFFLMGILDQGYWPDGLYTAPSDEALVYDITTMKSLGFQMLRKHIKVECARWYYHCDRLGMIVCQDMVNGGSCYHMPVISYLPTLFPRLSSHLKDSHYAMLSRKDASARKKWERECAETVEYLKFFPSIAIWTLFNEGWGQFDTARLTALVKKKDPSRLVDSASGWFDQNCGDFISVHNYFRPLTVPVKKWSGRAFFLSEYGGYACHIKGHSSVKRIFGYKRYSSLKEFRKAYRALTRNSLLPLRRQGLSGAVYTQLSDVEEEVNGLLTYDRKVNKLRPSSPEASCAHECKRE